MADKQYSEIWFAPNNFQYLDEYKGKDGLRFMEIGGFEGYGTNHFCDTFLTGTDCKITVIDPWIKYSEATETKMVGWDSLINESTYDRFIRNTAENASKIDIQRGLSCDILPTLTEKYDFIYVDGDHSTSAVWKDAILSFPLLKAGGIVIFDDYLWESGERSPKDAVDRFLAEYAKEIQVIAMDRQVVVRKIAPA
jgi:predicted O-methyltransferase YrrM